MLAAKNVPFGRVWFMRTSELLHSNPGVMFSEFQGDVTLKPKRQGGETQLTLSASQVAMHVGVQLFATWAAAERLTDWFGWPSADLDEHFVSCMEPIRPVWDTL